MPHISRTMFHQNVRPQLLRFCDVIDPEKKMFHTSFLRELVGTKQGRWLRIPQNVVDLIRASYVEALKKHLLENPAGPLPGQITAEYHESWGFVLVIQFKRKDGMAFRLRISYKTGRPYSAILVVIGKDLSRVQAITDRFLLNKPVLCRSLDFNEISLSKIRIPLGEILDLLEKYRV